MTDANIHIQLDSNTDATIHIVNFIIIPTIRTLKIKKCKFVPSKIDIIFSKIATIA